MTESYNKELIQLNHKRFHNRQRLIELGNQKWRVCCQIKKIQQDNGRIERKEDDIYRKLGFKIIKKEEKDEKDN